MEKKYGPAMPIINRLIQTELTRLEQLTAQQEKRTNDIEVLNEVFREMVVRWGL
jgi:hypothetical protein